MNAKNTKPVIFLAFANEQDDRTHYLRTLPEEGRRLRRALEQAQAAGICQLEVRTNATLSDIRDVFRNHDNRIAIFHFGGHADSYRLLFEAAGGKSAVIDAAGFAEFLAHQAGLQLVFLNACSTAGQVAALQAAGVPVVIATSQDIPDAMATDFADEFYQSLATGINSVSKAFAEATSLVKAGQGGDGRHLRLVTPDQTPDDQSLWQLYTPPGAAENAMWSLQSAANDPLFGLPPLPKLDLPETPYRHLEWFRREDAELFFGRGHEIAELYQRVTAPDGDPIILFYGQSGVGKSSVLAAGLLPRLEQKQGVVYQRRDHAKGIAGTLAAALNTADDANLTDVWRAAEAAADKPLTVILDQVEELFTRPNPDLPDEMDRFLTALNALFAESTRRPQGRLILSFRKEWLAEIEAQLKGHGLQRAKVFLERLNPAGIVEAIAGPARVPRLHSHYGLTVADDLLDLIADDLLADPGSPVAPMLQILLTGLWAAAKTQNYDHPCFDRPLYAKLRGQGLGLDDFLTRQLAALHARQAQVVESGLALDLLAYHTTPLGTAEQRKMTDLEETYRHQAVVLPSLAQQCRDLYLLVDPSANQPDQPPASRLTHDTLAPHVRKHFDESDAPGQRARRILESRVVDWQEGEEGTPLDEADLTLVEAGVEGMRSTTQDESRLVRASQQRRKSNRRKKRAAWGLLIIVPLVAFLIYQYISAEKRALEARSELVAYAAQQARNQGDYDLSLALALKANYLISQGISGIQPLLKGLVHIVPQTTQQLIPTTPLVTERTLKNLAYFPPGLTRWRLDGHTASVSHVAFHPTDSNVAVSSATDGTLYVWDLASGTKHSLEWHTANVRSFAFSPDGDQLIVGYDDGLLLLGEIEGKDRRQVMAHDGAITAVAISPDGERLLSGGADGKVTLWNMASNGMEHLWTFSEHTGEITGVAFSPTDPVAVSGSRDGNIFLIEINDGKRGKGSIFKDNDGVVSLAISPDGRRIFAGAGGDGYGGFRSCLWLVDDNNCLDFPPYGQTGHAGSVTSVAFSPDGNYVVSASEDQSIILWNGLGSGIWNKTDENKRTPLYYFLGHEQPVTTVAFSPDGKHILSGARDGSIRFWDLASGAEIHRLQVLRFALSPDGHTVLMLIGKEMIPDLYLWDVEGERMPSLLIPSVYQLAAVRAMNFSPDGTTVLFGSTTGQLCKFELTTLAIYCFRDQHPNWVLDIAFNPKDNNQAISSSYCNNPHDPHPDCRDTLILWDVNHGEKLFSFDGHTGSVTAVDFSPDGDSMVSGSVDMTIRLWDVLKHTERYIYRGHQAQVSDVAFSPDGAKILSGSADKTLRLWDVKNPGQSPFLYKGHTTPISTVAFSHHGRFALSGASDSLRLWDVQSGAELAQLIGHTGTLLRAAFLRDDHSLISQDWLTDYTLRVWKLPPEPLSNLIDWTIENRYIRDFTCKEREKYQIKPLCN